MKRRPSRLLAPIVALVLVAALAACDAADPAPPGGGSGPPTLQSTTWSVLTIAGRAPQPGVTLTISFAASTARGSGGCNQFGGSYQYESSSGRIAFKELGMTAMACVDNRTMAFESAFAQALTQATRLDRDADGRLHLSGPGGEIVLAAMIEG